MFSQITLHDTRKPLASRLASRRVCGPYTWSPTAPGKGRGFYMGSDGRRMDRAGSSIDLRLVEANSLIGHSRLSLISGYHCDLYGDGDTLTPMVALLPNNRGFLAGWSMGAGMCGALDSHVWSDAEEAARAAHDMAESDAEREQEAQARDLEDEAADLEPLEDEAEEGEDA